MKSTNGESPRLAGYAALISRHDLSVLPHWHESRVAWGNIHRVESINGGIRELYPSSYWPGDSFGGQVEFALKYDGVNLEILARLFPVVARDDVVEYIRSKPTSKYARRFWYLYEMLRGVRLPIEDVGRGNYVDLLDPGKYYTSTGHRVSRQRIRDNLLGDARFCPMVRRTDKLAAFDQAGLGERCRQVMADYPPDLLRRALSYLYTKETKSSFEIEHIVPNTTRTDRFVALLKMAEQEDFFRKDSLIALQNRIVDERFRDHDYRQSQNYVGETVSWQRERVHYISPKPTDLPSLMEGMCYAHNRMGDGGVHPVIHATAVAFGFVFMHPFEDGNGRIHRFLIHNILARRGFTPEGIMFPVSAAMLRDRTAYEKALEAFSRPLMALVEYSLDEHGRMTVEDDTAAFYRYVDMTVQAESLFWFIQKTVEIELVEELNFLRNYDQTKQAIQDIVDMPDQLIDLFIRFCLQNNGRISSRKRAGHFSKLTDGEVQRMEAAVQEAYRTKPAT